MRLLTAAQMREVDRVTIDKLGVPVMALMENAGRAVAEAVVEALRGLVEPPILVVCGRGNNGGDGLVAARHLDSLGLTPQVLLLGQLSELRSDVVRTHAEALRRMAAEAASDAAAAERLLAELFQPPDSDTSGAPAGDKEDRR